MSVWDKLDSGLASIYLNFLQVRQGDRVARVHPVVAGSGALHVTLQYTGDLAAIETAGFRTTWRTDPHRAGGVVELANLERVAEQSGVIRLSYGREPKPLLDKSIPDIRANQVWSRSGDTFGGTTGKGVIVGVIDTGIDFEHDFFLKPTPANTTRILRIWDQGLVPQAGEKSPDPARLQKPNSYGVEYTEQMINDHLRGVSGAVTVRHRDCAGHGTHVASIAAGNGRPTYDYVGVAPEADIIMVKYLGPETQPQVGGSQVDWHARLADAVNYILNVAAKDYGNRPVVINYSVGSDLGAHDGFSEDEIFLTSTFASRKGQIWVNSAGNSGGGGQHAYIEFAAGGGSRTIPCMLIDGRTNRDDYSMCQWLDHTDDLTIELYYPDGAAIAVEVKVPGATAFKAGPPLGGQPVSGVIGLIGGGGQTFDLTHAQESDHLGPNVTVKRNVFRCVFKQAFGIHYVGDYLVKVTTTVDVVIHLWCEQAGGYGLWINHSDPANPLPFNGNDDQFEINTPAGASNIITVASYDAETAGHWPADTSSRGPLASYPNSPTQPDKPDLAAPGEKIDAANSRHVRPRNKMRTVAFSGTSMAAPHVAGVVALMLQKAPTLTVGEALKKLKQYVRPATPSDAVGAGLLDAKATVDHTP